MMDRNGANKEEITAGMSENESYFNPHWSPNGEKIGAIHHYNNDTTSVVVIEVESRIESQVTKPYGLGNYSMPIWSTDNKWLAFHWNRDSNNPNYRGDYGDLYISDINGDALFRITQDNSTWWSLIAWRPD